MLLKEALILIWIFLSEGSKKPTNFNKQLKVRHAPLLWTPITLYFYLFVTATKNQLSGCFPLNLGLFHLTNIFILEFLCSVFNSSISVSNLQIGRVFLILECFGVPPKNNLHIHSKLKIIFRNMFKKIKQTSKKYENIINIIKIDYFKDWRKIQQEKENFKQFSELHILPCPFSMWPTFQSRSTYLKSWLIKILNEF